MYENEEIAIDFIKKKNVYNAVTKLRIYNIIINERKMDHNGIVESSL